MKIYSTGFYDADADDRRGSTDCHGDWHLSQEVVQRQVDDLNDELMDGALTKWRHAHTVWGNERADWNALVAAGRRTGEFRRSEPVKPSFESRWQDQYVVCEEEVDTDGLHVVLMTDDENEQFQRWLEEQG